MVCIQVRSDIWLNKVKKVKVYLLSNVNAMDKPSANMNMKMIQVSQRQTRKSKIAGINNRNRHKP